MRVIFLEDVTNVGHAGDIKDVKDGFARNYLIPKKLATVATAEGMKRIERIKQVGDARRLRESEQLEELASLLEGTAISVTARVTPAGQFYGAITPSQVAEELSTQIGRAIDRKLVDTVEPIKEPGEFEVVLHLSSTVKATIIVTAEAQE